LRMRGAPACVSRRNTFFVLWRVCIGLCVCACVCVCVSVAVCLCLCLCMRVFSSCGGFAFKPSQEAGRRRRTCAAGTRP
jgi:hypothetical protein